MREMKNSGIEWIGDIPSEWQIVKLKYLANILRGGSPRPIDAFLTDDPNGFNWIKIGDTIKGNKFINSTKQKIVSEGVKKSRVVHKGDLILTNSMSFGEPYILNIDGCIHDGWVSFSNIKNVSTNFLYYFLSSPFCLLQFKRQVDGGVVQNLNVEKIGSTIVLLPSFIQQERIADFLDKKCAEIDTVIEKTKATIEEYKKLKQSVITQAVTKGIRPNRPMKDSGIEWIGEIPIEWDEIKLKYCTYIRARLGWKGLKADEYVEEGYPLLSAFNIINNKLDFGEVNFINKFRYDESPEIKLTVNDILLVKDGAGIGKCAIVDYLPIPSTPNGSLAVVSVTDFLFPKFLYYYFLSTMFQKYIDRIKDGMGVPHLFQSDLREINIVFCSFKEQSEIADYLDKKCSEIDELIAKKTSLLSELESYKKSLIYEYVTGKKEV